MNNKQYFSQYESPNIVIVPTMSSNPPSPKKRKIGNNIIIPIVDNAVCEKLATAQEKNLDKDSNVYKKVAKNESPSKNSTQKSSWAANYLQSIGLDKKSSIWNRKIPRKTTSQRCVVSMEPPNNSSEATTSSTYVPKIDLEKNIQLNIQKKMVADPNTLKDSHTKIKHFKERNVLTIKDKSKKSKKSNHELKKHTLVKNPSDVKNIKTLNILSCKNKNILNDFNKIKTDKIKKNDSHDQPLNLCTSDGHSLHKKSRNVINKPSQKDIKSKLPPKYPPVRHSLKSENKVEKSNNKSVIIKEVQDKTKCNIKIKQTKSDRTKQSTSYSSNYKEKYKNSKYSMGKITPSSPMKNVKVIKKYDKVRDLNKADVLRKAQNNTEQKCTAIHNKTNTGNKTKTKEKSSNIKLDLTTNKKTCKSPIKRKTSKAKSYRKIKLVINLICNKNPSNVQCNESLNNENSGSKTCTVSNVDLDFLNDFNIDEIVESLDTCEKNESQNILTNQELNIGNTDKHSQVSNVHIYNTDAIDLIKTLKGEEDDDLMRISTENAKELLFRNVVNNITKDNDNSHITVNNVSKSVNSTIPNDFSTVLIKTEEKQLDTLKMVSSNAPSNVKIDKNVSNVDSENTCITKRSEKGKETHQTTVKRKAARSSTENFKIDTLGNLCKKLNDNKNESNIKIKEEQFITPLISELDSLTVFRKVNSDSCEELKLDDIVKENHPLDQQNDEKLFNKDQNKNKSPLNHKPQKIANTDVVNEIVDKENSSYKYRTNILQTDINSNESSNESIHNKDTDLDLHQQKAEWPDNRYRESASNNTQTASKQAKNKQQDNKTCCNNEESIKAVKKVQESEIETNKVNNNSVDRKVIAQLNTNLKNNKDLNNTAIINNSVKEEAKVSDKKVQDDKPGTNMQSDLQNNITETVESQTKLSDSDEQPRGYITKGGVETVQKLEDRLYNHSGSKYSINSLIHTGRFSKTFKCKHPNGKYYALKMITTNIKHKLGKEKKDMLYSLISDIPKNNLFIVNLVKAFNLGEKWCFLMEYYPKNLQQALDEAGKSFSIDHIQDLARQLVTAVMVLRNKNMVHLDIKPQHILINSSNNMLKLCGFDNLCYINKMKILPNVGTVNYRAPEVILGYESGFEIDVWSTGLVLYEMAANKKLFPGAFNNDILYKQICTLGCIPYDMLRKSRFSGVHFMGTKFMRKSGFKGQTINIVSKFYKNNKLCDSIYETYYENWGHHSSVSQQNCDIGKISLFIKLLQKMLIMHPESRLPIEFVYANPFIYDAYSYQEW